MKNIIKLSILSVFTLTLFSCDSDDEVAVAMEDQSPELLAPESGTAVFLDPDQDANPALTVVWNHGSFDVATQITYNIEIALEGTNFENPVPAGTTSNRFLVWTVKELNDAVIGAGLTPFEEGLIDIRVKASLGSENPMEMTSNTVQAAVTPYTTENPKLYIIGNFLEASGYGPNWTPAETLPVLSASAFGKTDFEGFVFINDDNAEYKFLPTNTSFDGDYGDASGNNGDYTMKLVQDGEGNCGLPAGTGAGYFYVKADIDPEILTYDVSPAEWAIVGGATPLGWPAGGTEGQPGNDHDMTYNAETQVWEITIELKADQFKFRANDDWALNLGPDSDGDGFMNFGGLDNLSVDTPGTYKVTLDLSNPREYTYSAVLQ